MTALLRRDLVNKAIAVARYAAREFGPLIVFRATAAWFDVKAAIALSILTIVLESAWRWRRGESFTRLYVLVSGLTLVFGCVDLVATNPFMLKYEAVVTNFATGVAFVIGACGEKPMLQEFAQRRATTPFPATSEVRRFFQLFTGLWAAYFFAKAALFGWLAWTLPFTEAMALRSLIGGASLALLSALSVTQGRNLFFLCRRLGLLPLASPGPERAAA